MKIIHFCAGLEESNGMANTARQFVAEELAQGHDSRLTNQIADVRAARTFDVLHIHGTWLPVLWKAAKIAKRVGAKVIVRPAGNYDPLRRRSGFVKRLKKLVAAPFEHAMLDRADVLQASCLAEAEWIKSYHPHGGDKVELTDLRRFFRLMPQNQNSPESAILNRPLHVLFLGRATDPLKGVRYLRRAAESINEDFSVLGKSENPIVELHIASKVFGAEKESEWAWCDLLCLPTLSENFGRVVAEALERGKPVITTDGAPAWKDEPRRDANGRTRLIYLEAYRDGTDAQRVKLLKRALGLFLEDAALGAGGTVRRAAKGAER